MKRNTLSYASSIATASNNTSFLHSATILKHSIACSHLLDRKTLLLVTNTIIFRRLFYCSNVWGNTSSKNIYKLQLIQNFSCRILLGLQKFDHVSAARKSIGWLCVRQKLRLNSVIMVHKCRIYQTPPYLCNLFHDRFSV